MEWIHSSLQVKEARRSVLELPNGRSRYAHQGLRVVEGQRLMQGASDIFLGWARTKKHDYYLRQFRDMKVSAEIETFRSGLWFPTLPCVAGRWHGRTLRPGMQP